MKFLTGKKFLLLGFIVILLAAIPLTVYFMQQQQDTRSKAAPSTTLSFSPTSTQNAPLQKGLGDSLPLDIMMNPGQNQVSFVKLTITFDATKLATDGAGLVPNTAAFQSVLEGPIYAPGSASITLSVGADPSKVIQSTTKIATLNLKTLATTDTTPTQVVFGNQTQVLSIASSDQPSENVLSTQSPALIAIGGTGTGVTPSLGQTTPSLTPTKSPTPTPSQIAVNPTTGVANKVPVCTNFTATLASQSAGLVNFMAVGNDTDGTITKATFNFGDGLVQDATSSSSASVSAQVSHTYAEGGTFQSSVIFTDNSGGLSTSDSCTKQVAITGIGGPTPTATPTATPTLIPATPTAVPTIAPTGPADTILGLGLAGIVLTLIGGLLFFAL